MTRCKHNKTGFGMCEDCMKWIKETEAKMKQDKKIEEIIKSFENKFTLREEFGKLSQNLVMDEAHLYYISDTVTDWLRQTLLDYREEIKKEIVDQLIQVEKEKWNDAYHCTCLGYAIVTIFGKKYEEILKDIKK